MFFLATLILKLFGRLYPIESVVFVLGSYFYFSYTLYVIAGKKKGVEQGWLAWIPLADIFLLWELSDQLGGLKIIVILICFGIFYCLFLNPLIILIPVYLLIARMWSEIASHQGIPRWLGAALVLLPVVNIAFIGYLAFSD